jgi:hypothetical protein
VPEWPDSTCPHDAIRQWEHARLDWLAADSNRAPRPGADERSNRCWLAADSNRTLPFGEFGDSLDVLREALRIRRSFPACPEEGQAPQWPGHEVRHA